MAGCTQGGVCHAGINMWPSMCGNRERWWRLMASLSLQAYTTIR